jgi:hypothetical protein
MSKHDRWSAEIRQCELQQGYAGLLYHIKMTLDPDGGYVLASDYDALAARVVEMETLARNAQAAMATATWSLPEKSEVRRDLAEACDALYKYLSAPPHADSGDAK